MFLFIYLFILNGIFLCVGFENKHVINLKQSDKFQVTRQDKIGT